jgi:integral membrane protein (TIGR01906 family)
MTTERKSNRYQQLRFAWIVTLLVPISLVLTVVRLLMFPYFLEFEYRTPNFPTDYYGFNREDRLYWSKIDLEYLLNSADITFLGNLRFSDGTSVYNQRELKHMVDVKNALSITMKVWVISLVILFILGLWAWRGKWLPDYRWGLKRGGWLTILLVGAVILFVLLGFEVFFVAFHNIFFATGTWMFEWSDTLIRLFPERFWRDIFIYIGVLSALGGLGLAIGFRKDL